jgi:DNA-binding transcriptional MerR regulator
VLRHWEEQQLISPTPEHGRLRYSPRDLAIAALTRRLLDAGAGVEGIRMLKRLAGRDARPAAATGQEDALAEEALPILYQRKAIREETGTGEGHYPQRTPRTSAATGGTGRPRAAAPTAGAAAPATTGPAPARAAPCGARLFDLAGLRAESIAG